MRYDMLKWTCGMPPRTEHVMLIKLEHDTTVIQHEDEDAVIVTRPTMFGKMATHIIKSPYSCWTIARYLHTRFARAHTLNIQDVFPLMSKEDREFLISGITPEEWNKIFSNDEEA